MIDDPGLSCTKEKNYEKAADDFEGGGVTFDGDSGSALLEENLARLQNTIKQTVCRQHDIQATSSDGGMDGRVGRNTGAASRTENASARHC